MAVLAASARVIPGFARFPHYTRRLLNDATLQSDTYPSRFPLALSPSCASIPLSRFLDIPTGRFSSLLIRICLYYLPNYLVLINYTKRYIAA